MFLDNAASHPKDEYSNIKLEFFPPNTTTVLQPLDGGIIRTIKLSYRKLLLQFLLTKMEEAENVADLAKSINLFDAINFSAEANKKVSKNA